MIIYKATCVITGKSYVGQTKKSLRQRIREHNKDKSNSVFHKAIRKYGKQNFIWSIIKKATLFYRLSYAKNEQRFSFVEAK